MIASAASSARALRLGVALALGLGLTACSKDEPAAPAAVAEAPATAGPSAEQEAAQQAAEQALAGLSAEELRARGGQALREQRLYAPAGDSAMEYYLALRAKTDKPDPSAESALMDLMPYAMIAAEQAIGREDFVEAERLRALIEKTDAMAPSLPRITDAIAKGQAAALDRTAQEAAREQQRIRDAEAAAREAATAAAAATAATPPPAVEAPAPAAEPVAEATPPVATPAPPAETAPAPAPAPAPAAEPVARSSTPVGVRTPQPEYPREAVRAGITGEITVEITIAANGSVSDVRVVRAQPRGTFERGVISTVRGWQFEPMDGPATITRTFTFRP
jgi:protein TonB